MTSLLCGTDPFLSPDIIRVLPNRLKDLRGKKIVLYVLLPILTPLAPKEHAVMAPS